MRSPLRTLAEIVARSPVPAVGGGVGGASWLSMLGGAPAADYAGPLNAMSTSGTLFTIVNGIASDVAEVDWHLHRTRNVRASSTCPHCEDSHGVALVEDHQALRLWNQPNDHTSGQQFREALQQHIDLTGEGWIVAELAEIGDFPLALWSPRPDRMRPDPDADEFISGYTYRGPDGRDVPLQTEEVVQIKMPNPVDPYRGLGPVQAMMIELDAVRFTAEWNRQFFLNSAEPGGLIEVPNELSDPAFKRLQAQWGEQHRGIRNAHRVGILENGATWRDRSFSQKDMQFVELYRMGKEGIREAFRYPTHMLGTVQDVNRSTAEAADTFYARRLLVPRLKRLQVAANMSLLPMFGTAAQGLKFVFTNPVPADREGDNAERESKATTYSALVDAGVHPDDAALVAGLPPMRRAERVEQQGVPA